MKKIEAIIRPEKLAEVQDGLATADCSGIMVSEIEGHGKQGGVVQQWRGEKYKVALLPKVKIAVVVPDASVDKVVKVIIDKARTGEIGDGKIFISPVEGAIRIRTGESGEAAL